MNFIYKFLYFLQGEMTRPTVFGWFHIIWLIFTFIMIYIFYKRKKFHDEKQLKIIQRKIVKMIQDLRKRDLFLLETQAEKIQKNW